MPVRNTAIYDIIEKVTYNVSFTYSDKQRSSTYRLEVNDPPVVGHEFEKGLEIQHEIEQVVGFPLTEASPEQLVVIDEYANLFKVS